MWKKNHNKIPSKMNNNTERIKKEPWAIVIRLDPIFVVDTCWKQLNICNVVEGKNKTLNA